MSAKKSAKELKQRAEYQKNSVLNKTVNFNRNTDTDLISYVETGINFSGYVKELIRLDVKKKRTTIEKYLEEDG